MLLVRAIRLQSDGGLARQILEEQVLLRLPGPAREAEDICREVGLDNVCRIDISKKEINDAITTTTRWLFEKK